MNCKKIKKILSVLTIFIISVILLTSNVCAIDVSSEGLSSEAQPIMIIKFNQNGQIGSLSTTENKPRLTKEECDNFIKNTTANKINKTQGQIDVNLKFGSTAVEFEGEAYVYRYSNRIEATYKLKYHELPWGSVSYRATLRVCGVYGDIKQEFTNSGTLTNTIAKTKTHNNMLNPTSVLEHITLDGQMSGNKSMDSLYGKADVVHTEGGKYSAIKVLEGERHHCPATDVLKRTGVVLWTSGPAVRMIVEDHKKTANWGVKGAAERQVEENLVRQGYFLKAQKRGTDDIENLFPGKYSTGIFEMVYYTTFTLGFKQ